MTTGASGTRCTFPARRLATLAVILAAGGALAGLVAALGSGAELWSFRPAFTVLRWAFFTAAAGGVLALVALLWGLMSRAHATALSLAALVFAVGYCGYVASWVRVASAAPAIHDVTTDLADPPQFRALPVRADNLETIPDLDDPALAALPPVERLHEVQRRRYPELTSIRLPVAPDRALAMVADRMAARGWAIAARDPQAGTVEATATVSLFRFRDDIVARVRPAPGGSVVDLRSVSRVGTSDLGVNAGRVRDFAADLRAAAGV